jgi:hypothetical protein
MVPTRTIKIQFLLSRFSSVEVVKLTKSNVKAEDTISVPVTLPVGLHKVWKKGIISNNVWVKQRETSKK